MFKYVILIVVLVIGYIAYTGVDVTEEYDSISETRNTVLDDIFDPLAKNVLAKVSESNLDEAITNTIEDHYGEMKNG